MRERRRDTAAAYAVHLYTASGVVPALLAAAEISAPAPRPARVLLLLAATVLIDATDGPLARRFHVKTRAPRIDGRTIDDILDYLTYTFLPLLLIWRMGWVPGRRLEALAWVVPAAVASLFGFANTAAKDEQDGFFLGFPSYWNVVALYAGLWGSSQAGRWANAALLLVLAALTLAPVRFLYPNLAPRPWRATLLAGAVLWLLLLLALLPTYPRNEAWLVALSLIYPLWYTLLSLHLARRRA